MSIERRPDPVTGGMSEADRRRPHQLRRTLRAALHHWNRHELVDAAELLLTELVTNALRHASGPTVNVRVAHLDSHLKIEVNDGTPRCPLPGSSSPDAEHGRGLFIVDAVADAWGVSEDRTTVWCTLPLTEGTSDMATPQIVREKTMEFDANPNSSGSARVWARSALTILAWPGPVHLATDVLYVLVTNAFEYGLPAGSGRSVRVALRLTEHDELLVDVEDDTPDFPAFDKAVSGELGRGLWGAKSHGAEVTWFPSSAGKTVRATLQAGPVDL
ncbi:ATP-binding protein [Streptomyces zhihengii]|uniref:ATP-binding protein n=2 Tax=Streptomyces zhihengii TaxID=1818004 RepID=A0ABS2V2R3_9ACTN|nr:ATP-binding protein [Streptomyces zhihengii]